MILEAAGVVPVAWAGQRIHRAREQMPVHKPADLAGMQVRAQPLPLIEETLAALKARPSAMSAADARAALESGRLDGQETSASPPIRRRVSTRGPLVHLQLWHAHADALVFAVNRSVWDSWSEPDRQLVREAARDASQQALAMARRQDDDGALARLSAAGRERDSPYQARAGTRFAKPRAPFTIDGRRSSAASWSKRRKPRSLHASRP